LEEGFDFLSDTNLSTLNAVFQENNITFRRRPTSVNSNLFCVPQDISKFSRSRASVSMISSRDSA